MLALGLSAAACKPGTGAPARAAEPPVAAPIAEGTATHEEDAPPDEPDSDSDGIPDRCDACPQAPGQWWDEYPSIDGCPTAELHALVREPEGQAVTIVYALGSTQPRPASELEEVIEPLKAADIDSIAVVGRADPAEKNAQALAVERAHRLSALLVAQGVRAKITELTYLGDAPAVDVGVLSRNGQEEMRFSNGDLQHVRAAEARERMRRARTAPSPCGRMPGSPRP